jgi:molecular chaperone DnaK
MKREAELNAEEDKKKQREAELLNKADSVIFQTEKQLIEFGDKIPADKKQPIDDALAELKTQYEAKNMDNLEAALEKLETVFQAAAQDMYSASNAGGEATAPNEPSGNPQDEVTDVDFEEVNDKK